MDKEESEEEVMPEGVPAIEVRAEGVPDDDEVPWDETVIPDCVGVEEIDWSQWVCQVPDVW